MYWQRGLPAFLATTLAFLILGVAARADVRTVTNSADNGGAGTLRAVIAAA